MSDLLQILGHVEASSSWVPGSSWKQINQQLSDKLASDAEALGADALYLQRTNIEEQGNVVSVRAEGLRGTDHNFFAETEKVAPGALVPLPRP